MLHVYDNQISYGECSLLEIDLGILIKEYTLCRFIRNDLIHVDGIKDVTVFTP